MSSGSLEVDTVRAVRAGRACRARTRRIMRKTGLAPGRIAVPRGLRRVQVSDQTDQSGVHYASRHEAFSTPPEQFAPQAGIGVSLSVGVFGFSVIMLGLADARVFTPLATSIFVPVAIGLGVFGLTFGGIYELRANNVFAGTFSLLYAGFLLATGLIL